jgi:ferrous iron transport protein B
MIRKILLVGNPNVGKSVVFSRLSGVRVIASNYPGTTVEISKGYMKVDGQKIEVVDLPGAYSLESTSRAEEVTVSLLREQSKDEIIVINVLDATNLERNLYLTLELIECGFAVVVSLNMCDDTQHRGIHIDEKKLEEILKVPVVPTCAVTGTGIKCLIENIKRAKPQDKKKSTHQQRWQEIGRIIESVQHLSHRHHTWRETLEDASVRPLTGILLAAAVVLASFKIVRFIGEGLISRISDPLFFRIYQPVLEKLSIVLGKKGFLHHLFIGQLIDGAIDFKQSIGLLTTAPYVEFGMVLPYVISFYLVLSVLEDVGYLPRLAILLDNLLHRIGLHGFTIIPVLLGFGCNVPGILGTRILESKRERFIASTLISIGVPCVALQAMIFGLLGRFSGFYVSGVYLVLFSLWLILGLILNKTLKGYSPELLVEIPPYRVPVFKALFKKVYLRIRSFLLEALPFIFLGVLLVNVFLYFKWFDFITQISAPIVSGIFGLPKEAMIALGVGFLRKDVAAGLLGALNLGPKQMFVAAVVLSISFPCIATFGIFLKELGLKALAKAVLIMIIAGLVVGGLLNYVLF